MSPVTIYIAKVLGLYCILIAVGMLAARRSVLPAVDAMLKNPPLLFVVGVMTIGVGLAMVVGHNVWTGGATPVLITLVGWASLAKGLALAFTPQERMARLYERLDYKRRFVWFMGATLLIGLYLTASGFGLI